MTEREALFATICASPDDDTPRLVLADWLEENGDPERAEFIRVQIALARGKPKPAKKVQLREGELLAQNRARWKAELPEFPALRWSEYWSRGFVNCVSVENWATFRRIHDDVFRAAPLQHLILFDFGAPRAFARFPALARLKSLAFLCPVDNAAAEHFLASPYLDGLNLIDLGAPPITRQTKHRLRLRFGDRVRMERRRL
jgi:uncharacterized protein (TIGR02996 family)